MEDRESETEQSLLLDEYFNVIHRFNEPHILKAFYVAFTMGGRPLHFIRPSISFTGKDEHTVQSIPQLIDFNAKFNPDYTFCIQAEKALLDDFPSFLHVTNAQLKQAIYCCAKWLRSSVQELVLPEITEDGADARKGSPIALLLDSDINLLVHAYTLMSLGVPVSEIPAVNAFDIELKARYRYSCSLRVLVLLRHNICFVKHRPEH